MDTTAIRDYFTDEEWDAIDQALCNFQDFGEEQAETAAIILDKIGMLFREGWHPSLRSASILSTLRGKKKRRFFNHPDN